MGLLQRNMILIWATLSVIIIGSYSLPDHGEYIYKAFDKFGLQLSEIVLSDDNQQNNIGCFPHGLALLLSAIATRANGHTKNDIKSILNVGTYDDDYLIFQAQSIDMNIRSILQSGNSPEVNTIGAPTGYWPHPEFKKKVLEMLKIEWIDSGNLFVPSTVININTEMQINKLTNYLHQNVDSSQKNTGFFGFANAISLQGKWAKPFTSESHRIFYGNPTMKSVQMMSQVNVFQHGEIPMLGIKFITIPYLNMRASMTIIMPTNMGSIKNLDGKLEQFKHMMSNYVREEYVELILPKFEINTFISMKKHLEKMGLADMFTHAGVFDVVENRPIHLVDAFQKVIIKVDDMIVENTADLYRYIMPHPQFIVDRPFIVLIHTDDFIIASAKINNV